MKLWHLVVLVSMVIMGPGKAWGFKYLQDTYHFSLVAESFTDVRRTDGSAVEASPSVGVELGLRFKRLFRTFLSGAYSVDGTRLEYGLGFRVDLPGFFLYNAKLQDFLKKGMSKPINTSFYAKAHASDVKSENGGALLSTFASDIGFSLSVFPWKRIKNSYIRADLGVYSLNGNAFLKYGLGLGFAF